MGGIILVGGYILFVTIFVTVYCVCLLKLNRDNAAFYKRMGKETEEFYARLNKESEGY